MQYIYFPGVNGFGVIITPKWSGDHSIAFAVFTNNSVFVTLEV